MKQGISVGAAVLIFALSASVLWAQNLTGFYVAEGRNTDASAYVGNVQIAQEGNLVTMAWQVGSAAYSGAGVLEGRVLTVNWGDATPVVYVLMPGGRLHGTWDDGRALERLTPQ